MQTLELLILDDEKRIRTELKDFLEPLGHTVHSASTPRQAFSLIESQNIDIAIVDVLLPEMNGLEVLERLKREQPHLEVLMITGHGDMETVIRAMRLGASDFFPKPFRLDDVRRAVEKTARLVELRNRLRHTEMRCSLLSRDLQEKIGARVIGEHPSMKRVIDAMHRVAATPDTFVLITGESGTGKELVARGIHFLSDRKDRFFHAVNCSATPDSLFESAFFGHVKGAFTGATSDQPGWFEVAHGGTLFLDEISEMNRDMQAKFLRVLEQRTLRRVGSHRDITFDVRVIAATNHPLTELTNGERLRGDLYHRLGSFMIHLPPLRERREDIPLLIRHFVDTYAARLSRRVERIEPEVVENLLRYPFPGNIRELRNMIERAVILCDGPVLSFRHFPEMMRDMEAQPCAEDLDLGKLEKNAILKALKRCDGNKARAAELLNITWQSLDRRIKKHGIRID